MTDGERDYSANFTLTVVGGRLALANSKPAGTYIIVRWGEARWGEARWGEARVGRGVPAEPLQQAYNSK